MKTLLLGRPRPLALLTAVNFSPRNGAGAETLRRERLGRHLPARRRQALQMPPRQPRHYEYQYGYDKHAAWRGHWVPSPLADS